MRSLYEAIAVLITLGIMSWTFYVSAATKQELRDARHARETKFESCMAQCRRECRP